LLNGKRRISDQIDTITFDIGQDVRGSFALFAHRLLTEKEAAVTKLSNDLFPPGSIAGISNRDLVRASAPVTQVRQIANWCNNQSNQDQQQKLDQLKELPRKWLATLCHLIEKRGIHLNCEQAIILKKARSRIAPACQAPT
jgi:hypothetical protein